MSTNNSTNRCVHSDTAQPDNYECGGTSPPENGIALNRKTRCKALPPRPSDALPIDQLQEQWTAFLDAHVGKPNAQWRTKKKIGSRYVQYIEILCDPASLAERIPAAISDNAEKPVNKLKQRRLIAMRNVVARLPARQREMLQRTFGIEQPSPESYAEIGRVMGIDRTTVSRSIRNLIANLRCWIRSEEAKLQRTHHDNALAA